jgi:hypothetical protein
MIDEHSKAYQLWKGFHGRSYFEEQYGRRSLYCNDEKDYKWQIDNLSLKDIGEVHYLSWTEENAGLTKLFILELQPRRQRKLEWTISPAKGTCLFWVNKWTEQGLFMVYNDSTTNYALRIQLSKRPERIALEATELGEMLCIKSNWVIGYKFYTDETVSLFDLKNFSYLNELTKEEAAVQGIIPAEQGEHNESLS